MQSPRSPTSASGFESPRLPSWEGPFKLMIKVVSANIKIHHSRPVVYDPKRVYAQVEFYRGVTHIVR